MSTSPSLPPQWTDPLRPRQEWKVLLSVLLVIAAVECLIRQFEQSLSKDLVHQSEIPQIIDDYCRSRSSHVLFLGNSLIREGIDAKAFAQSIGRRWTDEAVDCDVSKINPDDTSIVEWAYLFEEIADNYPSSLNLVVLGYAQNQLTDDSIVRPRRLGAHYLNASNRRRMLEVDVTDFAGRCEMLIAKLFCSFASADRVRTRLLASVVPDYEQAAQRLNQAVTDRDSTLTEFSNPTFTRFEHLVALAKKSEIQFAVVAIPVGTPFRIDKRLTDICRQNNIVHIDATSVAGIERSSFPDGYHMDAAAAELFTKFVADKLLVAVKTD